MRPRNEKIYNLYGDLKLRPWAMTDEEIDALLETRPEMIRLWEVSESHDTDATEEE